MGRLQGEGGSGAEGVPRCRTACATHQSARYRFHLPAGCARCTAARVSRRSSTKCSRVEGGEARGREAMTLAGQGKGEGRGGWREGGRAGEGRKGAPRDHVQDSDISQQHRPTEGVALGPRSSLLRSNSVTGSQFRLWVAASSRARATTAHPILAAAASALQT